MIETFKTLYTAAGHAWPAAERRFDEAAADTKLAENPNNPLTAVFNPEEEPSGVRVTELSSLQITAVWRAVSLIAGAVAKVPFDTYERTKHGRERAMSHYLTYLLRVAFNDRMSAFRGKRLMQAWLLLWGNAYAEIVENGRGQITALYPWRPDRVSIDPAGDYYTYQLSNGTPVSLPAHRILHLRGLEIDGIKGLSPIAAGRRSLGRSRAAEEYGSRFFANNGKPGGWISHPAVLGDKALKRLKADYESLHRGLKGSHRVAILEEGMEYHDVGVPPEDMQFLQTMKFGAEDVGRLFGAPLHKLQIMDRATFSNIEHQSIEFVTDCLGDWFATWESEVMHMLLSIRDQEKFYCEFNPDALLRGDIKTRYEAYKIGRQNAFLNANEIRRKENMNDIEGGEIYLSPLNMEDLEDVSDPDLEDPPTIEPDPNVDEPQPDDQVVDDEAAAAAKKAAAKKKAKKTPAARKPKPKPAAKKEGE